MLHVLLLLLGVDIVGRILKLHSLHLLLHVVVVVLVVGLDLLRHENSLWSSWGSDFIISCM